MRDAPFETYLWVCEDDDPWFLISPGRGFSTGFACGARLPGGEPPRPPYALTQPIALDLTGASSSR
eukprot:COSAG02_NODE_59814_length_273_cov_0.597701_1_plen_65_part_01